MDSIYMKSAIAEAEKAYAEGVYEVFLSFDQYRNTYGVTVGSSPPHTI